MKVIRISECRATPGEQFRKTPMMSNQKLGMDEEGNEVRGMRPVLVGTGEAQRIKCYGEVYDASAADARVRPEALETLRRHLAKKGQWGVGCPGCIHGDGASYFLQLRVNDEGDGYVPEDPAAWQPTQPQVIETLPADQAIDGKARYLVQLDGRLEWVEEVPTVYGYLDWRREPGGAATWRCPRCGTEVRIEP